MNAQNAKSIIDNRERFKDDYKRDDTYIYFKGFFPVHAKVLQK